MKTMIDCITTNSLCIKVQGKYDKLVAVENEIQGIIITPVKRNQLLEEKRDLSMALRAVCHECESLQRIKIARAELKTADRLLLEANEKLEDVEDKFESVQLMIYKRMTTERPELEGAFSANKDLKEYLIENDAEWIAHCNLIYDLVDKVDAATKILNEKAMVLDLLIDEL